MYDKNADASPCMTALRHLLLSFSVETLRGTNIEENTAVLNNYVVFNMPTKKLMLLKYNNGHSQIALCTLHSTFLYMVITINDNSRHRFFFFFFLWWQALKPNS